MNKDKKNLIRFLAALLSIVALYFLIPASYNVVRRQFYPTVDEAAGDLFGKMNVNTFLEITEAKLLEVGFIDVSKPLPKNNDKLAAVVDGIAKRTRQTVGVFRKDVNGNLIVGFAMSNDNIVIGSKYVEHTNNFATYSRYTTKETYTTEKDGIVSVHLKFDDDNRPDIMLYSYKK